MTRARIAGYTVFALALATAIGGCDPYDPLCGIYFTPECMPDDDDGCPCEDGSVAVDCGLCPPPPEVICICGDGSVVSDCGWCPPLPPIDVPGEVTVCPDGTVVIGGESCPVYGCADGSFVLAPWDCPQDPGGGGGGEEPPPEPPACDGIGQELYLGEYCICLPRWVQLEDGSCIPPVIAPFPPGLPPPQRAGCIDTYEADMRSANQEWHECMAPVFVPDPGAPEPDALTPAGRVQVCDNQYLQRAQQAELDFFECDQAPNGQDTSL